MSATRDEFQRRRLLARLARYRVQLLALLAIVFGCAAVWLVYFSTVLGVHSVEVEGAELLSAAQVREAAAVPRGAALAGLDVEEVEERVEALAPVAAAQVERRWPQGLSIVVTERRAVAVVGEGATRSGMDAEGVLFRTYDQAPPRLPLVDADELVADGRKKALAEVAAALDALEPRVSRRVDHVEVASRDAIVLVLDSGIEVIWGSAERSELKSRVLAVLLEEKAAGYDVSVPGQPTTRP